MAKPEKYENLSQDETIPEESGNARSNRFRSWRTGMKDERESIWDEPAFPDRKYMMHASTMRPTPAQSSERRASERQTARVRVLLLILLGVVALVWIAVNILIWTVSPTPFWALALRNNIATVTPPLAVLIGLALLAQIAGLRRRSSLQNPDLSVVSQAADAAARLGEAHAMLVSRAQEYASLADDSATRLLAAADLYAEHHEKLVAGAATTADTTRDLSERLTALGDAAPRIEERLTALADRLSRTGHELGDHNKALEGQLQAMALVAEEARQQLVTTSDSVTGRVQSMRQGMREAGDDVTNLVELSSARIDLTMERITSVASTVEAQIAARQDDLTKMLEDTRTGMDDSSDIALRRFAEHCDEIAAMLARLDERMNVQADRSAAWLARTTEGTAKLANEFDTLEHSAISRTEQLGSAMMQLSGETNRLCEALQTGNESSDQLIKRAESLLLALDSSIRELDESLPGAMSRVEQRIDLLQGRINDTKPNIEALEAVATGITSQLQDGQQFASDAAGKLTAALNETSKAFAEQKQHADALTEAVRAAEQDMGDLQKRAGPGMVEALARVRETADAAAAKAREAIENAIPQAVAKLREAGKDAMAKTVAEAVAQQVEQLSLATDTAVKAAHRASDRLNRQMLTLTDNSAALEKQIEQSRDFIGAQDREQLGHYSAELIGALNNRAIDVSKWLDTQVSQGEWSAYLNGGENHFVRRAVKLIGHRESRDIHDLYAENPEFAEHVNRYVHDFEQLLKTVLAARDGSALAVTMISSDIGKLYVALAQAIERLRSN